MSSTVTKINNMTNGKLADAIETAAAKRDAAAAKIWALASGPDERWSDITERLGDPKPSETALEYRAHDPRSPVLIDFRNADDAYEDLRQEARRRIGPDVHHAHYPLILRSMSRRKVVA